MSRSSKMLESEAPWVLGWVSHWVREMKRRMLWVVAELSRVREMKWRMLWVVVELSRSACVCEKLETGRTTSNSVFFINNELRGVCQTVEIWQMQQFTCDAIEALFITSKCTYYTSKTNLHWLRLELEITWTCRQAWVCHSPKRPSGHKFQNMN